MSHPSSSVARTAVVTESALNERRSPAFISQCFDNRANGKQFRFLALPLELRQKIYNYLLAHETERGSTIWRRGNTAILATNHQVHDEALELLYGHNTFHIEVKFKGIVCRMCYLTCRDRKRSYGFRFLEVLTPRTIGYIKHYNINIFVPDYYSARVKYNLDLAGMAQGVKSQVQTLLKAIRISRELRSVSVVVETSGEDRSISRVVLEPFLMLRNVRDARVRDWELPAFASYVEDVMGSQEDASHSDFECWLKNNNTPNLPQFRSYAKGVLKSQADILGPPFDSIWRAKPFMALLYIRLNAYITASWAAESRRH